MWYGIGKMCLEKQNNLNINVLNNYARSVLLVIKHVSPLLRKG